MGGSGSYFTLYPVCSACGNTVSWQVKKGCRLKDETCYRCGAKGTLHIRREKPAPS